MKHTAFKSNSAQTLIRHKAPLSDYTLSLCLGWSPQHASQIYLLSEETLLDHKIKKRLIQQFCLLVSPSVLQSTDNHSHSIRAAEGDGLAAEMWGQIRYKLPLH